MSVGSDDHFECKLDWLACTSEEARQRKDGVVSIAADWEVKREQCDGPDEVNNFDKSLGWDACNFGRRAWIYFDRFCDARLKIVVLGRGKHGLMTTAPIFIEAAELDDHLLRDWISDL